MNAFLSLDKTKQCVNFRRMLPVTKRQMDRQIYVKQDDKDGQAL